jgi:hypothetical protein
MNTTQLIPSPAPRLASRFAWAALASIGLAVFSLALAAPARAAGSSYPFAKWLVTLSFPNDQPLVELTTEIWSYNPTTGSATLITSQTEPLNCTVSGNLQISNGVASFGGQEHIACEQPDMVDKIYQVSQGILLVQPAAEVRDAWVRAKRPSPVMRRLTARCPPITTLIFSTPSPARAAARRRSFCVWMASNPPALPTRRRRLMASARVSSHERRRVSRGSRTIRVSGEWRWRFGIAGRHQPGVGDWPAGDDDLLWLFAGARQPFSGQH